MNAARTELDAAIASAHELEQVATALAKIETQLQFIASVATSH